MAEKYQISYLGFVKSFLETLSKLSLIFRYFLYKSLGLQAGHDVISQLCVAL